MHCWARPGEQYNCESIQVTISGTTSKYQWACHQFVPNALACSVFWSPPDVVHHCGCRFASLRWENSNLGCRWAPKTPRAPATTEASTGILLLRSRREGINLSPCDESTCAWTWQFELGNIWCTNKLHTIEMLLNITPLLQYAQFFLRGQRVANH